VTARKKMKSEKGRREKRDSRGLCAHGKRKEKPSGTGEAAPRAPISKKCITMRQAAETQANLRNKTKGRIKKENKGGGAKTERIRGEEGSISGRKPRCQIGPKGRRGGYGTGSSRHVREPDRFQQEKLWRWHV